MSNFDFLADSFPELQQACQEAEQQARRAPQFAAILSRAALEAFVHWMYDHDSDLKYPYDKSLNNLMQQPDFGACLSTRVLREAHLLRKLGNQAAHGTRTSAPDALACLRYLHSFACYFHELYARDEQAYPDFSDALLPSAQPERQLQQELEALQQRLRQQEEAFREAQTELQQQLERSAPQRQAYQQEREQVRAHKRERLRAPVRPHIPLNVSEAETRRRYIDVLLAESGWTELRPGRELEYPLQGMPTAINPSGKGYADYVLWGPDGKPLAVIEAKAAQHEARRGQEQARLYADCLEQMHGQRPLIFYTNGLEVFLWDDAFYPPRPIAGFLTRDELERHIARRRTRQDLRAFKPAKEIAGRPYQLMALRHLSEHLSGKHRRALLVMATGTGKTRTAAAIIDMLVRCQWAQRVLFLADRNALVIQAKRAISEQLPDLSCVDLTKGEDDQQARLVFSTYPTMMNRIDQLREQGGTRRYGPGYFDLIFVDEAHRSIYQKYQAIFQYFDGMLIGLTATPKQEVDRNTYELFGHGNENPTYAYELEQAVTDGYLVPYRVVRLGLKLMREGVRYRDLTPAEREEYEDKFGDPTLDEAPEEIGGEAINKWLFNTDTVDHRPCVT